MNSFLRGGKKNVIVVFMMAFVMGICQMGWGQTSAQNFGTSATTYSSGSTGSASYIPNPTSGTTYARTSNGQGGAISLNTTSNPLSTTGRFFKSFSFYHYFRCESFPHCQLYFRD